MAFWLVRAVPIEGSLGRLWQRLERDEVRPLQPFGPTLDESLRRARRAPDGAAVWEEEDYCEPPLAEERAAVLDEHFREIEVTGVRPGEGWERIEALPSLWSMPSLGRQ